MAQQLELKAGDHVLEIGCGWGGFAEFAAREYGARVTGITISDEQLAYAQARMRTRWAFATWWTSAGKTIATLKVNSTRSRRSKCSKRSASNIGRPISARSPTC